jgi:hypothetical protein
MGELGMTEVAEKQESTVPEGGSAERTAIVPDPRRSRAVFWDKYHRTSLKP